MKAHLEIEGEVIGSLHLVDVWRCEHREQIRRDLQKTFKFLGEEVKVRFQDECVECSWPLINGKCRNKWCMTNLPDDEEDFDEDTSVRDS